jgi:hypothetical protein
VAVKGVTGAKAIAAGTADGFAVLSSGSVMAWGADEAGQLGNGTVKEFGATPVTVKNLTAATAVAAGADFALALLSNGTLEGWGSNLDGQLANPEAEESSAVPVPVGGVTGASSIAAGEGFALALVKGSVLTWGENNDGQLGDGTSGKADEVPTAVTGLSGASAIAAGADHALALLTAGGVQAWGRNTWGALGDGTTGQPSDVPVAVSGLARAAAVAAGGLWSLADGEPIPAVSGLLPTSGPGGGGNAVTISGVNFQEVSAVTFGTANARSFEVESPTTISAVAPAGTGTVDVHVTTPAGTSSKAMADRYTYVPAPAIKKLTPTSGSLEGGETVTITGTALEGATEVEFGSTPAESFKVVSATTVTAVAPRQPLGTVEVTVTTPYGTSPLTTKDRFKYLPVVEAVSPGSGETGTVVTITGAGFALGSTATIVKFGSVRAKGVECTSTTTCTAPAPKHAAGTVQIAVTVDALTSAKDPPADEFTYG